MPIPNRSRNKDGTFHKKRADVKQSRYTKLTLESESAEKITEVLSDFRAAGIKYKDVSSVKS